MCKELFSKGDYTMTQEIEIEFKNIVTKEEFDTLCKSFSIEAFTKQVNHYFETPDFSLKKLALHFVFVIKEQLIR